jgi:hypothetical protein
MSLSKLTVGTLAGSAAWLSYHDDPFYKIVVDQRVRERWQRFSRVKDYGYQDKLLIPVNPYVIHFGSKPDLKINGNVATLTQRTHSEFFLGLENNKKIIYPVERTMQRHFYPSSFKADIEDDCFNYMFRFYTPWILNKDITVKAYSNSSAFTVYTKEINFKKKDLNDEFIDCEFVHFSFKIKGDHMIDDEYGIIEIGTEMYSFDVDDPETVELLIKEYDEQGI